MKAGENDTHNREWKSNEPSSEKRNTETAYRKPLRGIMSMFMIIDGTK